MVEPLGASTRYLRFFFKIFICVLYLLIPFNIFIVLKKLKKNILGKILLKAKALIAKPFIQNKVILMTTHILGFITSKV